jgi:hypothetical protein
MRQSIHHHYEQLTDVERLFVDTVFDGKVMYELAANAGIPLKGDDTVERAVDALARAVIESRPKVVPLNRPGEMAAIYAEETGIDYATALIHCNMD